MRSRAERHHLHAEGPPAASPLSVPVSVEGLRFAQTCWSSVYKSGCASGRIKPWYKPAICGLLSCQATEALPIFAQLSTNIHVFSPACSIFMKRDTKKKYTKIVQVLVLNHHPPSSSLSFCDLSILLYRADWNLPLRDYTYASSVLQRRSSSTDEPSRDVPGLSFIHQPCSKRSPNLNGGQVCESRATGCLMGEVTWT